IAEIKLKLVLAGQEVVKKFLLDKLLVRLEVGPSKFCQEAKKRLRLAKVQARKVKACLEVKLRFLPVKLVKVQLEALEFLSLALEFLSLALIFLFQTRETVQ
ncbi:hypothetical protein quinque_000131, partial [Culex quinquefasciatus]